MNTDTGIIGYLGLLNETYGQIDSFTIEDLNFTDAFGINLTATNGYITNLSASGISGATGILNNLTVLQNITGPSGFIGTLGVNSITGPTGRFNSLTINNNLTGPSGFIGTFGFNSLTGPTGTFNSLTINNNLTGPSGFIGTLGVNSITGPTGRFNSLTINNNVTGPSGYIGTFGFNSLTGPTGTFNSLTINNNVTGPSGYIGTFGFNSLTGPTGRFNSLTINNNVTGPSGFIGTLGVNSITGPTGRFNSLTVNNNLTGPSGFIGTLGVNSITGPTGQFNSLTINNNLTGPSGFIGTFGFNSMTGPTGFVGNLQVNSISGSTGRFNSISGATGTYNQLVLGIGSLSNPSIVFNVDADTGLYAPAPNNMDYVVNGAGYVRFNSAGIDMLTSGTSIKGATGGTVSAPSFTFSSDQNSGLYQSQADNLDFTVGGVNRLNISSSGGVSGPSGFIGKLGVNSIETSGTVYFNCGGVTKAYYDSIGLYADALRINSNVTGPSGFIGTLGVNSITGPTGQFNSMTVNNKLILGQGSSSNPTLIFTSDADSGFYNPAPTNIIYTINAVDQILFNSAGIAMLDSGTVIAGATGGTVSAPSFTFDKDRNSGLYQSQADNLDFTVGGVNRLNISSSGGVSGPSGFIGTLRVNDITGPTGRFNSLTVNNNVTGPSGFIGTLGVNTISGPTGTYNSLTVNSLTGSRIVLSSASDALTSSSYTDTDLLNNSRIETFPRAITSILLSITDEKAYYVPVVVHKTMSFSSISFGLQIPAGATISAPYMGKVAFAIYSSTSQTSTNAYLTSSTTNAKVSGTDSGVLPVVLTNTPTTKCANTLYTYTFPSPVSLTAGQYFLAGLFQVSSYTSPSTLTATPSAGSSTINITSIPNGILVGQGATLSGDFATSGTISFTAFISATSLVVTVAPTPVNLYIGAYITGTGVAAGTRITAGTGSPWTINISQSVTTRAMTSTTGKLVSSTNTDFTISTGLATGRTGNYTMSGNCQLPVGLFCSMSALAISYAATANPFTLLNYNNSALSTNNYGFDQNGQTTLPASPTLASSNNFPYMHIST
jgi:hypothetical protein